MMSDLPESFATASDREQKLRVARRLEALGQMTGGVAHDFNNLLTVVIGNAEILAEELPLLLPDRPDLIRAAALVLDAGERGAELTRRLLAFARRQALAPVEIDIVQLLNELEPLLARSVGPRVTIETRYAPRLWRAEADESQLENAIINLAINARDAMPEGGTLRIEASNERLTEQDLAGFGEASAGDFLRIAVEDTGLGMTPEVQARAFEPFFTTKEAGRGTGLGLATVYGFIRQSRGALRLDSAPGQGTRIELLLPALAQAAP
ncbi:hypothetical protein IAI18_00355 [Acetobacteraceae bacterium H6797]|nr:hypothetical protein [Acetobacteraceae bacterium H6797]